MEAGHDTPERLEAASAEAVALIESMMRDPGGNFKYDRFHPSTEEGCLDHGKKWRATAGLAENAFPDKYRGITDNFDGADMQAALARYMFKCPVCDYVYGTRSKRDRAMQGRALCPCCRVLLVRA